jgi:hypothetical protein
MGVELSLEAANQLAVPGREFGVILHAHGLSSRSPKPVVFAPYSESQARPEGLTRQGFGATVLGSHAARGAADGLGRKGEWRT